jgi:hypothetical protein
MARLRESARPASDRDRAPVEKVFAYLDVPENALALVPQLLEVTTAGPAL